MDQYPPRGMDVVLPDQPMPVNTRAEVIVGRDGAGNARILLLNPDGSIATATAQPTSSTVIKVTRTSSSTTLLASNPNRKGGSIYNDCDGVLLVKWGAGAALDDFSFAMPPRGYYEIPFPTNSEQITGIWLSDGSGFARVTESV